MLTLQAHPRRVARVAKQIEREVGTLLLTDRVLQGAVCPEVRLGLDTNVSAIASVTDVELSRDMQVCICGGACAAVAIACMHGAYISIYVMQRGHMPEACSTRFLGSAWKEA